MIPAHRHRGHNRGLSYQRRRAMSSLIFFRGLHELQLFDESGELVDSWDAYNNVDSSSKGIWPDGRYAFSNWLPHAGLGVDSAYGTHGIYIFNVPGRTGMGVHAGRKNIADGLGRKGPEHASMGCIRT